MDIEPTEDEIIAEASFIEMKAYVKYCLYFGYGKTEIAKALRNVGWQDDEIAKAFEGIKVPQAYKENAKAPEVPVNEEMLPPSPVMRKFVESEETELEAPKPSS